MRVIPVIIAGGSGTRLWPLSTVNHPKLFLKVNNKYSLLQNTLMRSLKWPLNVENVLTVLSDKIFPAVQEQYSECTNQDINFEYVIETVPRNTAPAVLAAAIYTKKKYSKDDILVILPADHIIANEELFGHSIKDAIEVAKKGYIVTLGIEPDYPETGYGYINIEKKSKIDKGYKVNKFVEKPDIFKAQEYLQSKEYLWNAGIFCASVEVILNAFQQEQTQMYEDMQTVMTKSRYSLNQVILDKDSFIKVEKNSIDYAIIEKMSNIAVIPCKDILWSDVGSWPSLSATIKEDTNENKIRSDENENILHEVSNTVLYSTNKNKKIVLVGVNDLLVVDTGDALLISKKDDAQKVKEIIGI
jgi:mannose-1-phosphate guanylyltransferase/mannose-6-phosphate isomerase